MKYSISVFTMVFAALLFTTGNSNAQVTYLSGASCQAANQAQAFDLGWDHFRILNVSTFQRWVICPFVNSHSYTGAANEFQDNFRVGTYHNSAGFAFCILRRYPFSQTSSAIPFSSININVAAGPYPQGRDTTIPTAGTGGSLSGFGAKTVTCRLDSGIGINGMITFH